MDPPAPVVEPEPAPIDEPEVVAFGSDTVSEATPRDTEADRPPVPVGPGMGGSDPPLQSAQAAIENA